MDGLEGPAMRAVPIAAHRDPCEDSLETRIIKLIHPPMGLYWELPSPSTTKVILLSLLP